MFWLVIVSVIWAFSFGLIKGQLTGLDSNFVAWARLLISMVVFLPFLRLDKLTRKTVWQLFITGMLQYGLMYAAYIYSYLSEGNDYLTVRTIVHDPMYLNGDFVTSSHFKREPDDANWAPSECYTAPPMTAMEEQP